MRDDDNYPQPPIPPKRYVAVLGEELEERKKMSDFILGVIVGGVIGIVSCILTMAIIKFLE